MNYTTSLSSRPAAFTSTLRPGNRAGTAHTRAPLMRAHGLVVPAWHLRAPAARLPALMTTLVFLRTVPEPFQSFAPFEEYTYNSLLSALHFPCLIPLGSST